VLYWVRVGNVTLLHFSQISADDMLLNGQNQHLFDLISDIVVVVVVVVVVEN
jgi:hypothetical protein